jgi:predicted CXXCH cytochrome family protein
MWARIHFVAGRLLLMLGLAATACREAPSPAADAEAAETAPAQAAATFVDEQRCIDCHKEAAANWRGSHHEQAMADATDTTVLADFDDTSFTANGVTTRFYKRGGKFFVHTEAANGEMAEFQVRYTFGVTPLQQYLIARDQGHIQCLTIAWDTERKRWFSLYPDAAIAHDDALHWTGALQRWNSMCAECHSTGLRKNFEPTTASFATTWEAINVGCQACHGPGSAHVSWAQHKETYGRAEEIENYALVTDPGADQFDVCARCHSRRGNITAVYQHGESFFDHYELELLRPGRYHVDGQILDEVYVYGSFMQSRMHAAGVQCTDCHDAHSARLRTTGNGLCVQCHNPAGNPRFPSLRKANYDDAGHHFHPAEKPGSQCVDCHMAERTYMGVDPRRDHRFHTPRPDLSIKLGVPNACTQCHNQKTDAWAAAEISKRFPDARRPNFAETLARGRRAEATALPALLALVANADEAAIVRATAVEQLRPFGKAAVPGLRAAADDLSPLVRTAAARASYGLPAAHRVRLIAPLLSDPFRTVRHAAAVALADSDPADLVPGDRTQLAALIAECRQQLRNGSDLPGGAFGLAILEERLGNTDAAIVAYQRALSLDDGYLPAAANLANLYSRLGRNRDAEPVLRRALARVPAAGDLHYSLGLLLAEEQRLSEALPVLKRATELLPERPRVWYNYGLSLQHLERRDAAKAALQRAAELAPQSPDFQHALLILNMQQEDWPGVVKHVDALLSILPAGAPVRGQLEQLRATAAARIGPDAAVR